MTDKPNLITLTGPELDEFIDGVQEARLALLRSAVLLKRYLQNHCENADAEGMGSLCECKLCGETRKWLGRRKTWPTTPPIDSAN